MVDEIYDRGYQVGRRELHSSLDNLVGWFRDNLAPVFAVMRRIEFDAPWNTRTSI